MMICCSRSFARMWRRTPRISGRSVAMKMIAAFSASSGSGICGKSGSLFARPGSDCMIGCDECGCNVRTRWLPHLPTPMTPMGLSPMIEASVRSDECSMMKSKEGSGKFLGSIAQSRCVADEFVVRERAKDEKFSAHTKNPADARG